MASKEADVANKKAGLALERVQCIRYPICFKKYEVQALFDSGSEVNVITSVFAVKLSFKTRYTNVRAQKIHGSTL